jgi:uncharacterized membrane protein
MNREAITWRQALSRAAVSGTAACLASTAALTALGWLENRRPVGPNNGPSQWFLGRRASRQQRLTLRHTGVGYAVHHVSSIFWATLHERFVAGAPRNRSVSGELALGLATAAIAAFVDYRLTPRRLQPGFEKHLSVPSVGATYIAFGLGLGAARLMEANRRRVRRPSISQGAGLMETVEKTVEVDRPIRTVYNQWTQFEDFPHFMAGVKEVRQIDDTHLAWHAEVFGKDKEWEAEITEQEPDRRISWKSISGAPNAGTVRFEPLGADRTRVRLAIAYEPEGLIENVGDALGAMRMQVESSVKDFKEFIESRAAETGAWRGEVDDSKPRTG